jgi:hypothetical protein
MPGRPAHVIGILPATAIVTLGAKGFFYHRYRLRH